MDATTTTAVVLTITHPDAPATVHTPQPTAELFDQITAYMSERLGAHPPVNLPGSLAYSLANAPLGTDIYDPATGATFRLDPAARSILTTDPAAGALFGYPKPGSRWGTDRVTATAPDAITLTDRNGTRTLTYDQFAARYL